MDDPTTTPDVNFTITPKQMAKQGFNRFLELHYKQRTKGWLIPIERLELHALTQNLLDYFNHEEYNTQPSTQNETNEDTNVRPSILPE